MSESKKPSDKVLEFAVPKENIEAQLEDWIRRVFESNDELATALTRIRDSYRAQLAVHCIKDADEILAQVEGALQNAAKAKNVV